MKLFQNKFQSRLYFDLSFLVLASLVVTLPIFYYGVPSGNDLAQHYQFAMTFYDALKNGVLYPGWADAANFGFGDVGVRFYPPFSYYVLVLFRWIFGNWYDASSFTFLFWFFLSGLGVYYWTREFFDETSSLAAALAYIVMPYHVNQIYNAFLYAEFAASAILPFCFLFVTRICKKGKLVDIAGLSASYSLLILTHLPLTIVGSIALLVYAVFSLRKHRFAQTILKLSVAVVLAVGASSFYWLRVLTELDLVKHNSLEFTAADFDFQSNFLFSYFSTTSLNYGARSLWFIDLLAIFTFAFFVPSAIVFYYYVRDRESLRLGNAVALVAVALFFATPLSSFVWKNFTFLQKMQFPWRWMTVISIGGVVFIGAGFQYLARLFRTKARPIALLASGLIVLGIVFTATQVMRPAIYASRTEFTEKTKNLSEAQSCDCWWPIWSKREAFLNREKVWAGTREIEIDSFGGSERIFRIAPGIEQNARIAIFYYPNWRAIVNGYFIPAGKDEYGTILVPLPPEQAEVRLFFQESDYVKSAGVFSFVIWLVLAGYLGTSLIGVFIQGRLNGRLST